MSEIIEASTLQSYPFASETYQNNPEALTRLHKTIGELLVTNNIAIENVLFAGHGNAQKQHGEHWQEGQDPTFYFGDERSLRSPQELAAEAQLADKDEIDEREGEHWAVNPLNYALRGGALSIYDKAKLSALDAASVQDPHGAEDREAFGTYAVQANPNDIQQAKVAALYINKRPS